MRGVVVFMRSIKYRAFYKGEMRQVTALEWIHEGEDLAGCYLTGIDKCVIVNDDETTFGVDLLEFTGLNDRNGTEIYESDIIKWNTGIGYIKYRADEYTLGFEVEVIAGSNFYGYEGEHYPWTCVEVIGNIYEGDLINKYKYGVTASFKPVSRESAKKKFVNALKIGLYHKGDWVPTQAYIPERIGIRMQDVVTELRDELVKEGKIIQDPAREWMCRVEESPELLEKGE
ncbi:MAG: YopX protein [Methanobacterium sp. PtaU1.Bin097]|nr:MAG: YopX protein [Methanobacterium sp. PtaU1.Bin097]